MLVNGIEIEIEHKPIKNLHLAVYPPNGRVHVSAPNEYTDEQIKLFIFKKWVWITLKRKETMSYTIQDEREYISGEAHFFKGGLYRLKVKGQNLYSSCRDTRGLHYYICVRIHFQRKYSQCVMDLVQRTINTNNGTVC